MQIKMRLRMTVLLLLFVTVLAPIVLYTDRLDTFSSSPTDEFVPEPSTLSSNRDVRSLKLLPKELSASQAEPLGDACLDDLAKSVLHPDGERSWKARQLNEESKGLNTVVVFRDDNPIKQVAHKYGDNRLASAAD